MSRILCVVIAVCISSLCIAQQGDLFLSHHNLNLEGLDNVNFEIKSNNKGQICIANRSGVLLYDGNHWEYIPTPSSALSIAFDNEDNIFIGCVGDFGKIDYKDNKYQFVSLNTNKSDDGIYFKTVYQDSSIFFLSEENILRYHLHQKKSNVFFLDNEDEFFTDIFPVDSAILVQTSDSLYQYANDTLGGFEWDKPEGAEFIFFNKHPTREWYVAGTTDNQTYIYKNQKFYECKISAFLNENESFVDNGQWLNDRYFALSTLENGCILYDNKNSKIVEVINQSKGLPDNQIHAIGVDKEEGLWISHDFGLTRMEIGIPFRSFSNFNGLHGSLSEAFFYKRTLYVATSEGVYHLDPENVYKNTVYYTTKKTTRTKVVAVKSAAKEVAPAPSSQSTKSETRKRKKRNRKKYRKKESSTKKETKPAPVVKEKPKTKTITTTKKTKVKKVRKELIETKYMFEPVAGIHSKIENFVVYQDKLFAAGTNGVYEIKTNEEGEIEGELVIHAPVKFISPESKSNRLIIGTLYNEIKLYELEDDVWIESEDLNLHGHLVMSAFNDQSGRTWFVTPNSLLEFQEFSTENLEYNTYDYKNQFIDDVKLSYIDRQLYLINSEGYFYLHTGLKQMVEDTVLMQTIGKPVKHLQQRDGIIWVFNGENWFMINRDKTVENMSVFGLFPEMTYVSKYGSRHWLINDSKEVLQYEPAISDTLLTKNKMFFRRVTNNKGDVKLTDNMSFEHDESSIHFEMSRPDYRGILKAEYQFKLKGMHDNWSEWSDKNYINFNFLPRGKYQLSVRSRDSSKNIQESQTISFTIKPPFWQTIWFYCLQILFMSSLVITSMVMNRRAKTKYVIITEGLTVLTIVLVIEFLQTVAAGYLDIQSSPVIDFGINVVIALIVFPLEQFLKKYMKAENTGKGLAGKGLFDFLLPNRASNKKKDNELSEKSNGQTTKKARSTKSEKKETEDKKKDTKKSKTKKA